MISRYARRALGLLSLANLMNFYSRQIVSALAEAIKAEFALTDAQVGGLNSAFELAYPLAAVALAMVADRWGRQRVIALTVALWSVATALSAAAGSYLALVLARLGVGVGQGGYGSPAVATLAEVFPGAYRARAVAVHEVGLMLGSAAGYLLGGLVAEAAGWRVSFFVAGLPGLLLAWLIWGLRPISLATSSSLSTSHLPIPQLATDTLRQLFAVPTLRLVYASGVLVYLATGGLIFWLPTFMQRFHGYTLASAAAVGGAAQVAAGVAGVLAGGWLGDRLVQRHPGGRLLTMSLGLALGTPLGILAILTPSRPLFLATAGLALFFYAFGFPCTGPQIHDVTPPDLRTTAQAVFLLLSHYLGNLPSAPLVGWLSDGGRDLRSSMAIMPGLGLPCTDCPGQCWPRCSCSGERALPAGTRSRGRIVCPPFPVAPVGHRQKSRLPVVALVVMVRRNQSKSQGYGGQRGTIPLPVAFCKFVILLAGCHQRCAASLLGCQECVENVLWIINF